MGIGALALKALGWITGALGIIRQPAGRELLELAAARYLGAKAPKYLAKLAALEAGIGANTALWAKLEAASAAGVSVTLTPEEVEYGMRFKRLWDKHVKAPLSKLPVKFSASAPSGDTMAEVEALKTIMGDEPDDDDPTP